MLIDALFALANDACFTQSIIVASEQGERSVGGRAFDKKPTKKINNVFENWVRELLSDAVIN